MTVTTIELAQRSGITVRQADYWTGQGLLVTTEEVVPGRARHYDEDEVRVARALGRIRRAFGEIDLYKLAEAVHAGGRWWTPIEGIELRLDVLAKE